MFDDYKRVGGIYCFENKINGKKYIGKSIDLKKRILDHINSLRINKDKSVYLQNAWNKYGEKSFIIYILCEENNYEKLSELEIFFINKLNSKTPYGYNLTNGGDGTFGYKWSEELRKSIAGKRNHFYGKIHSEKTKEQMSISQRGEKNHNYGKTPSEETRRKMSENHYNNSGEKHPNWGKRLSKETRNKISNSVKKVTSGENNPRFGKKLRDSSSKYFGVYFVKRNRNWQSKIRFNKKEIHIGTFYNETDAAMAYDKYVMEHNLPNPLNFPKNK